LHGIHLRWLELGLPGPGSLGCTPGKGMGHGDFCRPITLNFLFDESLTALSRDISPATFQLYNPPDKS